MFYLPRFKTFVEKLGMLTNNLTYLRTIKGKTQEEVAKSIGISRSTYAGYETGKSEPAASVLSRLADYFLANESELLRKDLGSPLFSEVKKVPLMQMNIRVLATTVDTSQCENIHLVPTKAVAGYISEYNQLDFVEKLPHLNVPNLREGTYRAFEIEGDSMTPIQEGFIVVGKYVQNKNDLKNNVRYILVTSGLGIVFKKIIIESQSSHNLLLVSDNANYHPYTVDISMIQEAWEMVTFIGYPTIYDDTSINLNERLITIERKLNKILK